MVTSSSCRSCRCHFLGPHVESVVIVAVAVAVVVAIVTAVVDSGRVMTMRLG